MFYFSKQTTPTPNGAANSVTPTTPTTPAPSTSTATEIKVEEEKPPPDFLDSISKPDEKSRIGFPTSQMSNLNVGDYRTLVKTLVCGVKTITWGCASCKVSFLVIILLKFFSTRVHHACLFRTTPAECGLMVNTHQN